MSEAQASLKLNAAHACFGGAQRFYEHFSSETGLAMKFSVYLPPKAVAGEKVPALLYLAGLSSAFSCSQWKACRSRAAMGAEAAFCWRAKTFCVQHPRACESSEQRACPWCFKSR